MLFDPENIAIAVGILLLSCIQAEICVMPYLLPVSGCHLWFAFYPHVHRAVSALVYSRNPWPRKQGYILWNFFPIMYTNWDKRYFLSTPRLMAAIFDFRRIHISGSSPGTIVSLSVLPDLENTNIEVWLSFLSGLRGEIWLLPVWRRHLGISTSLWALHFLLCRFPRKQNVSWMSTPEDLPMMNNRQTNCYDNTICIFGSQ
jgi:hypothetical protein